MKLRGLLLAAGAAALLSSCAAYTASPATGFLFTDVKYPMAVTDNSGASKVGTAELSSILGIVATGDASIDKAAKEAGISEIHHVDVQAKNILGIYATYKIYVYGE